MGLSTAETAFLVVFWAAALYISSNVEFDPWSSPAITELASGLSWAAEQLPLVATVLALLGALYGLFKYRVSIFRGTINTAKKLTCLGRRKRR